MHFKLSMFQKVNFWFHRPAIEIRIQTGRSKRCVAHNEIPEVLMQNH